MFLVTWAVCNSKISIFFSWHDMTYGGFKDWHRTGVTKNVLCDKPFNIARNPKYGEYQRDIASMLYNFFDRIFCYWYKNRHYYANKL